MFWVISHWVLVFAFSLWKDFITLLQNAIGERKLLKDNQLQRSGYPDVKINRSTF